MRVTYDPRRNIAYIRFRERTTEVETLRISDELSIDLAPDGSLYGIELLNANEQVIVLGGTHSFEDTATGKRIEVAWPDGAA